MASEDEAFELGWRPGGRDVDGWQCVWCLAAEGKTTRIPLFREEDVGRVVAERTTRAVGNEERRREVEALGRQVALMHEPDWSTQTASDRVVRQLFSDLRFLERIGRGGMGSVFRARRADGSLVAAKVLRRDVRKHPEFRARMALEIELLGRLDHPGIVRLLEHREIDDTHVFVMELVEGRSLVDMIREGPLPRALAVSVAIGVLEALAHAHGRGVLHRDVKPSNVIVDAQGRPKLVDFGIGRWLQRAADDGLTAPDEVVGTKGYIAPEAFAGRGVDERADVYAAGVLLYEMLTGEHAESSGARGVAPLPSVDAGIDEILARAAATDPALRFAGASQMAAALRELGPA